MLKGLFVCLLIGGGSESHALAKGSIHQVQISGMAFSPEAIVIKNGDEIIWTNTDLVNHSVTAKEKEFNSGAILPGMKWRHKFNKKGQFLYNCVFHPLMKAKIVVN
ncbi:MAG: cupredoxin domain-containing protein [Bacteriovorax sp.]